MVPQRPPRRRAVRVVPLEGDDLVLGYTYGSGDTVSTMVHPAGDHVVAQLRVDEAGGNHTTQVLTGQATYPISGGPLRSTTRTAPS